MEPYLDASGKMCNWQMCWLYRKMRFTTEKHDAESRGENIPICLPGAQPACLLGPSVMTSPCQHATKVLAQDPPESKPNLLSFTELLFDLHKIGYY